MTPNAFLIGASRSGTTSMFTYLGRHPSVGRPPVKEPHHFGRDLDIRLGAHSVDRDAYLALFAGLTEPVVLDGSTSYLLSRTAAEEIAAFAPDARILVNLRSPADVVISLHRFLRSWGAEPRTDVLEAFRGPPPASDGRLRGMEAFLDYRRVVSFGAQLRRYRDVFGADRVHVTLFDDLAADPDAAVTAALDFLDVDPVPLGPYDAMNEAADVRSFALQRLVVHPPRWLRRLAAPLPARLRRRARAAFVRSNRRRTASPHHDPAARDALSAELAPVVDELEELLGRDLSAWRP